MSKAGSRMSEMLESTSANMIPDTLSSRTLIASRTLFLTFLHGSTYQYNGEVFQHSPR